MYPESGNRTLGVAQARTDAATMFLAKVFYWMAIGLGLTGIVAYVAAESGIVSLFAGSPLMLLLILAELGLVFYLSARVERLSPATATGLFVGYSGLNGLTLSTIFLVYTRSSIAGTFFIAAGMFAAMAIYGLVTKRDLTRMGSFLFMGLIGIVIASLVNIFLKSPMISWVVSGIGVIVFTGLTAYDVQKLTRMGAEGIMEQGEAAIKKGAILGALALYLDFINLFLMLLNFFGSSRD